MRRDVSESAWPAGDLEYLGRCPICESTLRSILYDGLTDRVFHSAEGSWQLNRCHGCSAAYLDPRPGLASIDRAYAGYYTHLDAISSQMLAPQNTAAGGLRFALRNGYLNRRFGYSLAPAFGIGYLLAQLRPLQRAREDLPVRHLRLDSQRARLLDVGCGNGGFLKQMAELGWQVRGLDPDPEAVRAAARAGVPVDHGSLLDSALPDDYFDVVTLSHVIEHLHDPAANLRACYRALRPGGLIWIGTPNLNSLAHAKFRSSWRGLEPPRHLVLFTVDSLQALLEGTDFKVVSHPPVLHAEWFFRTSSAIKNGRNPLDPPPLSRGLRTSAMLADFRSWLRPRLSEELVLIARKGAKGG